MQGGVHEDAFSGVDSSVGHRQSLVAAYLRTWCIIRMVVLALFDHGSDFRDMSGCENNVITTHLMGSSTEALIG